ncbi:IS30 family transposase [Pararhizobium capsulatum DSM 1112]|uniref:IS30 family transposase n=1 Tax=Pararhizobium capsulatum DSM 1112 TaxID=1121113 RepID=A0ABU0BZT4_9HYPH|nr:IS30 family transposase [Pararhizobium capsulatum DSM 1112]
MSRCYTQITLADRRCLHHLVAAKVPVNEMARRLGRHRSTIYREIKRNTFRDRELPDYDGYYSTVANDIAQDRRRRLKKLRRHPNLRTEIIKQLEARWSPEQIAGRLLSDGLSRVRVCKETIYRFIYSKEDYGLGLYQYLPEARRKRRPLRSRKPRDGAFPAPHRISQRPDFIGDRSQFGHWEGDLLIFERPFGHANVTSLVERKSRYTVLIKNPSRHSRPIMDKIIRAFSPLPAFARQSFTFDRGTEFAGFRALEEGIGAQLVLRPKRALAKRNRREHQQAHPTLPTGHHRLGSCVATRPSPTDAPYQRPTAQMPRIQDTYRSVYGAFARR